MVYRVLTGIKSAEMNVSDLDLFKKSKIIKIAPVKIFLWSRKVWHFLIFSEIPQIFVLEIHKAGSISVPDNQNLNIF